MNIEIEKIYFDLDGVLADFDRGVIEFCRLDPPNANVKVKKDDDIMWTKIKEIPHFYERLELMPEAKHLFELIHEKYRDKCEILSGIPKPKRGVVTAGEDKINWVHKNLSPNLSVNIVLREEKIKFCKSKSCILIDDLQRNIDEWNNYGGTGILHTSPQNTIEKLKELGIL